jgi:hypothetical protein
MSEVYKLGIFMKFDSLEAVLLGDEAWACELTMDELAFVGGGYGSGYGAAPAPVQTLGDYYQSLGYREIPSSTGGSSGWYVTNVAQSPSSNFSIVSANTGQSLSFIHDAKGALNVADTSQYVAGLSRAEAVAACNALGAGLVAIAKAYGEGEYMAEQVSTFCEHAVDNQLKLYDRVNEAEKVVYHVQSENYATGGGSGSNGSGLNYYSNGSGGGSWGSGYGH